MRIDGQVTTGAGTHTRGVPVPTKATPREGRGILEQLDTARVAREARTLRTIDPSVPDRWTNPSPPATTATVVTPKARPVRNINHGTIGGYRTHLNRGEAACELCLEANRAAVTRHRNGKAKPGVTPRKVSASRLLIVGLVQEGLTVFEIAERTGFTDSTVRCHLKRAGLKAESKLRPIKHGSSSGSRTHRRRGETPCGPCAERSSAVNAAYKAARRTHRKAAA